MKRYFTSESVTEGHPDKVCDLIADRILDEALRQDPKSRVACEICCTTGFVMVMGEFTTESYIDIPHTVRDTIKYIGYDKPEYGFDYHTCAVLTDIKEQSTDIAMGVDNSVEDRAGGKNLADRLGAGDQGMMFGYACNETEQLLPLPSVLSHRLTSRLTEVRKDGVLKYLRPDGKAQVTVIYENGVPTKVDTVVVSAQHDDGIDIEKLREDIKREVILKAVPAKYITEETKFLINPTGRFVIGGPHGDSGLTGRKIIVDTYGGMCPHGGGAFSGKDPTKVDRSASYYARYVCKNIVASGLAEKCQLQLAYAIGKANPVSVSIETFGTSEYNEEQLIEIVNKVFDFRPYSIIENLGLRAPIYAKTTNYGHFGKPDLPWEKTDKVEEIKRLTCKN